MSHKAKNPKQENTGDLEHVSDFGFYISKMGEERSRINLHFEHVSQCLARVMLSSNVTCCCKEPILPVKLQKLQGVKGLVEVVKIHLWGH